MAINKVVYGGQVKMDITDTTAEASDVASGEVFYDRGGNRQVGTGNYGDANLYITNDHTGASVNSVSDGSKHLTVDASTASDGYWNLDISNSSGHTSVDTPTLAYVSTKMDKVSNPTANDILVTGANGQAVDSGVGIDDIGDTKLFITDDHKGAEISSISNSRENVTIYYDDTDEVVVLDVANSAGVSRVALPSTENVSDQVATKQDLLRSGTNIKTINGKSVLGGGDLDIVFTAEYGYTEYQELLAALQTGEAVLVKGVPFASGVEITVLVNSWSVANDGNIEIDSIATVQGDLCDVSIVVANDEAWTSTFTNRDPFMLLDFGLDINVTLPYCTENVANTSIPNVDVIISDEMGADWAIASLAKYEVKDSAGNRINCFPVCMFSMNGQKTLRLRMMCAGTSRKTAKRISGAMLLRHR